MTTYRGPDVKTSAVCGLTGCVNFEERTAQILGNLRLPWQERWDMALKTECEECRVERQRRKRVLGCEAYGGLTLADSQAILETERYAKSLLILEFNRPVCLYSLLRAKSFARVAGPGNLFPEIRSTLTTMLQGFYWIYRV